MMDQISPKLFADTLDLEIGERIRCSRQRSKLSLVSLAAEIGLSHQQLQKYETGASRISAAMLYQISEALEEPMQSFYPPNTHSRTETISLGSIDAELRKLIFDLVERLQSKD